MTLEERVAALESELAIRNLESTYALTWDHAEAERWAELFTDDGVFELVAVAGRSGHRVDGRAALAGFCRDVNRRWTGIHLMHPPELHVDGDAATGRIYFQFRSVIRGGTDFTQVASLTGRYDVEYARTGEGWRIRRRVERAIVSDASEFFTL